MNINIEVKHFFVVVFFFYFWVSVMSSGSSIAQVKCLSLVVIPVITTTLEDPHTKNNEVVTDTLVRRGWTLFACATLRYGIGGSDPR